MARSACGTACRKLPAGNGDHGRAQLHHRLAGHVDHLAGQGDAGEVTLAGGHGRDHPGVGRQAAALGLNAGDVDVQAGRRQGDVQGRGGLGVLQERRGQARQGRKGRDQARIGDRAFLDLHQVPGAALLEAQTRPALAAPGVQGDATARGRRRGEGRQDLGLDPLMRQLDPDLLGLPVQIGLLRPVLAGATAAFAEVLAGRRDAVGAGVRISTSSPRDCRPSSARTCSPGRVRGTNTGPSDDAVALGADRVDDHVSHSVSNSRGGTFKSSSPFKPMTKVGRASSDASSACPYIKCGIWRERR
jgi:hypothetical protein